MTPPIFSPNVLSGNIDYLTNGWLNTAFDEVPVHCRLPEDLPFSEMHITPTVTPGSDSEWMIRMFRVFDNEFTGHRVPLYMHGQSVGYHSRTMINTRFVRPERRDEPWV